MVNVVGLGYIGLPTALMLAAHGVEVTGTDCSRELVDTLNRGTTTFQEKGLDGLFQKAVSAGIRFSSEYICAEIYIISVPTPYNRASKKIDASYVRGAVEQVLEVWPGGACARVHRIAGNNRPVCAPAYQRKRSDCGGGYPSGPCAGADHTGKYGV